MVVLQGTFIWHSIVFNETLQVSKRLVELSLSYDNKKFQRIVLPNSRHVSSIKQEGVGKPGT